MFRTLSGWPTLVIAAITIGVLAVRQVGWVLGAWDGRRRQTLDFVAAPLVVLVVAVAVLRIVILSK